LQPRAGVLGVFSSSCHNFQELVDFENSVFNLHDVLLLVLLVLLSKCSLELFGFFAMLLKGLLVFCEINLKNIIEDAALCGDAKLRSLG
jgi:hypothetical protein